MGQNSLTMRDGEISFSDTVILKVGEKNAHCKLQTTHATLIYENFGGTNNTIEKVVPAYVHMTDLCNWSVQHTFRSKLL